jgi:hypothetical protein
MRLHPAVSSCISRGRFRVYIPEIMRLSKIILFFSGLLLTAGGSVAGDGLAREDGVRLLEACRAADQLIGGKHLDTGAREDAALCIGFVEGFIWGQGWKSWRSGEDMYFCPPQELRYQDALPALVSYLEAHPERLIQRAHLLLFSALSSAYPCTP